jgi:acyl-phosphate glycerol 3-phosphate acyltransferase
MPPLLLAPLVWLGAYLTGAIPFGYLIARSRGVDIFKVGSGNIGATNVGRVLGKKLGILVFVLDVLKGALPVAVALALQRETPEFLTRGWLEVGAGLAAFLGHLFPLYLGFRGGKGVATGAGVALVLVPGPTVAALLTWVTVAATTNYISLASLAAATVLCGLHWAQTEDLANPRTLFCLSAGALVFAKHRGNIRRLLRGTENKIGWGEPVRRMLHVLTLGLWFGSAVFFTFVVAPTLFGTFAALGAREERPAWFPLPQSYTRIDSTIQGPTEQGGRAFGYAVAPLFHWYFLVEALCAFIATWTALAWSRENPGAKIHGWRFKLLIAALAIVLAGWPLERYVAELRDQRNLATDAYLSGDTSTAALEKMKAAREEFGHWHFASLVLNFTMLVLLTGGMALAGEMPPHGRRDAFQEHRP